MRVTFVLNHRNLSGGVRVIAIYADRLARRGHQVTVVSRPRPVPSLRRRVKSLLSGNGWPADPNAHPSHLDHLGVSGVDCRVIDSRRPIVDDDVPDGDVVIATWWETAAWVNALSPEKGAKVYFVQDFGAHDSQPLEKLAETWNMPMHKIVISRYIESLLAEHCRDRDWSYVPNSVDLADFHCEPRGKQPRPTVGMMYARSYFKGADICLEAIRIARESLPNLHVVGFGAIEATHELPPGAEFRTRVPDEELKSIYGQCDAWLFGPRKEGFGLPILEAMACRTPVIATPAGAAPELLERGGGKLVRHEDPADMARAIVEICSMDDAAWRAMSDRAYGTVTGFTWDDATDLFEAALRKAANRAVATPSTAAVG